MEPNRVGRFLGIGTRVAGSYLRQRAGSALQPAPGISSPAQEPLSRPAGPTRANRLGRGTRNLGSAIFHPFAHATGILWLEITGLFFGIFALGFAANAWKLRAALHSGPTHQRLLLYSFFTVLFVYFSASSFYRASRKQKRKRSNPG